QFHLATAALFRRCADNLEGAVDLIHHRAEADCGGEARCADQVVAAAVADVRQRVVLCQYHDRWPRPLAPLRRAERRLQPTERFFDLESRALQFVREELRGEELLIANLRLLMDLIGHGDDPRPMLVNRPRNPIPQLLLCLRLHRASSRVTLISLLWC